MRPNYAQLQIHSDGSAKNHSADKTNRKTNFWVIEYLDGAMIFFHITFNMLLLINCSWILEAYVNISKKEQKHKNTMSPVVSGTSKGNIYEIC